MGLYLDPLWLLWGLLAAVVRDSLYYCCPGLMALYGACGGKWLPENRQSSGLSCLIFMGSWRKINRGGMKSPPTPQGE